MKKLLFILVIVSIANFVSAQCTPGNYSGSGVFPAMGSTLPFACDNQLFSMVATVIVPADTTITPFPSVPIDSSSVKKFIGFPSSFTFTYNTNSHYVHGDSAGCVVIEGTPDAQDVGTHQISLVVRAYLSGGLMYEDTVLNYWTFEVKDSTHVGISTPSFDNEFNVYPNPSNGTVNVKTADENGMISIYDLSGKMIYRKEAVANETIKIEGIESGLYMLRFEGEKTVNTARLLITE